MGELAVSAGISVGLSLLRPRQRIDREGPRVNDLTVQSSAFGQPIPFGWGTVRLSGNVIWAKEIEEVKSTTKQGGKGGGVTQTNTTYSYFATFAIGLTEGLVADVLKLYADGKLIYDKTGTGDDVSSADVKFRFYPGSETQEPDSIIEADLGVNQTPAFRGLSYIVFDRLPLKDFGNRVPSISAVITFNSQEQQIETEGAVEKLGETQFDFSSVLPDFRRGSFYIGTSITGGGLKAIRHFDIRTMEEVRARAYNTTEITGNSFEILAVLPNGFLVIQDGGSNSNPIKSINLESLRIEGIFPTNSTGTLDHRPEGFEFAGPGKSSWLQMQTSLGLKTYFLQGSAQASVGLLDATDGVMTYVWHNNTSFNSVLGTCPGAVGDGFGEAYYMGAPIDLAALTLRKITASLGQNVGDDLGVPLSLQNFGVRDELVKVFTPDELLSGMTNITDWAGLVYDQTDDTVMFQFTDGADNQDYMTKVDPNTGTVLWTTPIPDLRNSLVGMNHSRVTNGTYGEVINQTGWIIRTTDGALVYEQDGWTAIRTNAGYFWDSQKQILLGITQLSSRPIKYSFLRGQGGTDTTGSIVSEICQRAGIAVADLDTSALTDPVPGYLVTRPTSARGVIEPIQQVFFFDGVESDWVLKFSLREGKSSTASIPERDLARSTRDDDIWKISRQQEIDLPLRLSLIYIDSERDFDQQTHSAKRILNPVPAVSSRTEESIEVAISLTPAVAKQAAESALYARWQEREGYEFVLPWRYLAVDPADLVTVTFDDGEVFEPRVSEADIGADFTLEFVGVSEETALYTSSVAADGGSAKPPNEFLSELLTRVLLLNTPLLRDSDSTARESSVQYVAMGGFGQSGWTAASLFKSSDNIAFDEVASVINEMTWGLTSNALGDPAAVFQTDEVNTLTVQLLTNTGTLESITQLEMLNGGNPAALIKSNGDIEIIQFRDVTTNADSTVTLSGLLRGRRGTDRFATGHQDGEVFVLLDASSLAKFSLALSEVAQNRFYKGVGTGQLFEEADTVTNASPGNDLKPYAPVHLASTGLPGSDITVTWVRRSRIAGDLRDGSDDIPLAEDSEAYDLVVLNGEGSTTEVRSIAVTSESAVYTSANQSTDYNVNAWTAQTLQNASFELGTISFWDVNLFGTNPINPVTVETGTDGNITGAQDGSFWLSCEGPALSTVDRIEIDQDFDLLNIAGGVTGADNGLLDLRVTGYVASSTASTDTGRLEVEWLDSAGASISTSSGTDTDPTDVGTWTQIQEVFSAPAGARTARIRMVAVRNGGSQVNVSFDNISLESRLSAVPPVTFAVYQKSAQVGRGFKSETLTTEPA